MRFSVPARQTLWQQGFGGPFFIRPSLISCVLYYVLLPKGTIANSRKVNSNIVSIFRRFLFRSAEPRPLPLFRKRKFKVYGTPIRETKTLCSPSSIVPIIDIVYPELPLTNDSYYSCYSLYTLYTMLVK